jgi:hypothetical protein
MWRGSTRRVDLNRNLKWYRNQARNRHGGDVRRENIIMDATLDDASVLPLRLALRQLDVPEEVRRRTSALTFNVLGITFDSRAPFASTRALVPSRAMQLPSAAARYCRLDNNYTLRMCAFDVASLAAIPPPVAGDDLNVLSVASGRSRNPPWWSPPPLIDKFRCYLAPHCIARDASP